MVSVHPKPVERALAGRFIYISGCDGTGKSTQAQLLLGQLAALGARPRHLWLRFPFLLSLPLLAYARWRGLSWMEEHDGARHGYWDFRGSWLLRAVLPWLLLLDAALAALGKIYLPLWRGHTIVCERFALDLLVDLAVAFDDRRLIERWPGALFRRLVPPGAVVMVIDLDAATARARRPDLRSDRRLDPRLEMFRHMARTYGIAVLSSREPIADLNRHIHAAIGIDHER